MKKFLFAVIIYLIQAQATAAYIKTNSEGYETVSDTDNQLEWMNWAEFKGIGRYEMETKLTQGNELVGWRYASFDEIHKLATDFFPFFTPSSRYYYAGSRYGFNTVDYSDYQLLENLITHEFDVFADLFGGEIRTEKFASISIVFGDIAFNIESAGVTYDAAQYFSVMDGYVREDTFEDIIYISADQIFEVPYRYGHALVRDIQPVSAPASVFALMLLGVVFLTARKR